MMMYNNAKDVLRSMRMRSNDLFKQSMAKSVGVSLLYTIVSLALSFLTLFVENMLLSIVLLLVLAFIAASLQIGLCEYFLLLRRGEKPGAKLLMRYFDQDSLPMVAILALINWAAGLVGMLFGAFSLVIQIMASAMIFLAPYLYVMREGKDKPANLVREAMRRMQGRWEMYVRIMVRQYLYTLGVSLAVSLVLSGVLLGLSFLGLGEFLAGTVGYIFSMGLAVVLAIGVSAFVTAYFQIYLTEFAVDSIDKTERPAEKEESDFIL